MDHLPYVSFDVAKCHIGLTVNCVALLCLIVCRLSSPIPKDMFSQSVKTLGVMLDTHLTMKNQVINLVRTANFELRGIIPFITIFL